MKFIISNRWNDIWVSPLEMAGAYAAVANDGNYIDQHSILK